MAGEAFLDLMLLALTHGTVLVLLTWVTSATLLRRCRPSIHAALWTLVLIKFLLPPVLPGGFGLSPLLSSFLRPATSLAQTTPETPDKQTRLSSAAEATLQPPASDEQTTPRRRLLPVALLFAYASLVSLFGWRALLNAYRMRRRVEQLHATDNRLADEVAAVAVRLGLRRPPRVRTTDATTCPFVVGVLSPTLVMPASLPARIDAAAREALIIHELAHIRRRDTLVRWLRNAARLLFFFWPPVWWLCRRVERFSEMACDEWAVRLSSVSPQLYAEALLDVAKAGGRSGALASRQIAFASRDTGILAARFEMILGGDYGKPTRVPALASAALAAWGLFVLAGGVYAPPVNGASVSVPASEVFDEALDARDASHGLGLTPHPSATNAAHDAEQRRPVLSRRNAAPGGTSEGTAHRRAAQTSSEEVTGVRQRQGRGEVRPAQQTEVQGAEPHEVDLNGDGIVSDFEAGYSAGLRQSSVKREGVERGLAAPAGRRTDVDADALRLRREIELRAMRRERPSKDIP